MRLLLLVLSNFLPPLTTLAPSIMATILHMWWTLRMTVGGCAMTKQSPLSPFQTCPMETPLFSFMNGRTFEVPQIPCCLWGCLVELVIRGEGLHFLGERANVMVSALFTGFLHRRPTLLWQSSFQRSYAVSHWVKVGSLSGIRKGWYFSVLLSPVQWYSVTSSLISR